MKRLAFFTILSIFAITNQLQAQEPTKQETIDWIASKFKAISFSNTKYELKNIEKDCHFLGNSKLTFEKFEYPNLFLTKSTIVDYDCNL